jgi:dethiobiotin synthetase
VITVLCVGTATGVGKTWVGAEVLRKLRAGGLSVAARKPVLSFDPAADAPTDADVLAEATGEDRHTVCPEHRWYPMALAPPIAAMLLGLPEFSNADLSSELEPPIGADMLWVETIGGPLSPMTSDGDSADIARWLFPDLVVLVADAGLGTINAVRLAAGPFAGRRLVVMLNRYEANEACSQSQTWLAFNGFEVVVDIGELAAAVLTGARS